LAVSLALNGSKSISARQLSRDLQVNKNTAWRVGAQISKAIAQSQQRDLLKALIDADKLISGIAR
jgi:hypothetical protein